MTERFLPDKAIDLIDEAASKHVIDAAVDDAGAARAEEAARRAAMETDAAAQRQDFEAAARIKQEVLKIQAEYDAGEGGVGAARTPTRHDGHASTTSPS